MKYKTAVYGGELHLLLDGVPIWSGEGVNELLEAALTEDRKEQAAEIARLKEELADANEGIAGLIKGAAVEIARLREALDGEKTLHNMTGECLRGAEQAYRDIVEELEAGR